MIDELLKPTQSLWKNLEYNCQADCCGVMAFSFKANDIWSASLNLDRNQLIKDLNHLLEELSRMEEQVLYSTLLNETMDRRAFQEILIHLNSTLKVIVDQS